MKRIYLIVAVVVACVGSLTACSNDEQLYNGPSYVLFADTLNICPVVQQGSAYALALSATRSACYDRTFGVEVIQPASNAVEGYHYTIASNTVTIPAGQLAASVDIRGIYEHIAETDSLGIRLRIVALDKVEWPAYGLETNVYLQKICPYVIDDFTGYAVVESSFLKAFKPNAGKRLITTGRIAGEEHSVMLHDLFSDGYDVQLTFDNADQLKPRVGLRTGDIVGTTQEFLGTTYNDNVLRITDYLPIPSTFNACRGKVRLYSIVYVKDVGTLGAFQTDIRWISDSEAEDILNNGF